MSNRLQWHNARVGERNDKRVKIPKSLHVQVKRDYRELKSLRAVARKYGVSHRLIGFIIHPEKLRDVNYSGHWERYYDTKKNTLYRRRHRQRLVELGIVNRINK